VSIIVINLFISFILIKEGHFFAVLQDQFDNVVTANY